MSRVRAVLVSAIVLAGGTARAVEIRLSLVSHPGAPQSGDLSDGLMVRAVLVPDVPGLAAGDFEVTIRAAGDSEKAVPKPLSFIAGRLRGAWYFDVRELPVLDRGRYVLGLLVRGEGRLLGAATLERELEYLPPQLDVALIIDQSFSMRRTDPERLRVAAAKQFVDLAASGNRIRTVCVIAFDERSQTLVPPTAPSERGALHKAIDQIATFGRTAIDAALAQAHAELSRGPSARKAAILLTDGKNEPKPYAEAHRTFADSGWPVFTIGLSAEADANTLRRIARGTGGTFHDAPTNDKLREIFSRICFALERRALVVRESAALQAGETFALPLPIDDTISRAVFSLRSKPASVGFHVAAPGPLERPERSSVEGPFKLYSCRDPAPGQWTPSAHASDEPAEVELEVSAHTHLFPVLFPLADEYPYGESIEVACSLANGPAPCPDADVRAELRAADGKVHTARLADEGGGLYTGRFAPPVAPGEFDLSVSARGTTGRGFAFRRQALGTGRVAPPSKPELWVSADRIDLGRLHNGETGRGAVQVRKVAAALPGIELQAAVEPGDLPAEAFDLALGKPDADGNRELSVRFTIPEDRAAGECFARLRVTLGPDVARTVDVRTEVVNPRLVADPAVLDFGEVEPGRTETRCIRLGVTGPVDVDAAVTAALDAALPADAIDLHGETVRLTPTGAEITVRLAVPPLGVGEYAGQLHFRGRHDLGSVAVRLKVAPFASFVVEPETVELGPVYIGRRSERTVLLRSVVDSEQRVRIEPAEGAAFTTASPDIIVLPPLGTATIKLVCLPPLDTSPGDAECSFRLAGPMLPRRLTAKANLVVPPDGTFRLASDHMPLGNARPGDTLHGTIRITSTIDVQQRITLDPDPTSGVDARLTAPEREVLLPPGGTVEALLLCSIPDGASNARARLRVMVRGPLNERLVTVNLIVSTPPPGAPAAGRYTVPLLLLLGILLTLVLVILIIRALLEIPGHRMAKYFAASAVLNLGFFFILTQMLAVGEAIEESYVVVRLEGASDSFPTAPDARPDHKPLDVDARERQTEAERRKAEAADRKKDLAQAEQAKLEAQLREQARERAKLETRIAEPTPELSKLTNTQLEDLVAQARELERKMEQAARADALATDLDEPRLVAQSEEQKQLEAALELAQAARKLQAERAAHALPEAALQAAESAAAKLPVGAFERLVAEAQAARRHAEDAAEPGAAPAQVDGGRALATQAAGRREAGSAAREMPEGARDAAAVRAGIATPNVDVSDWRGGSGQKLAADTAENLNGEARAAARKMGQGRAADAPETGVQADLLTRPPGDGTKRVPATDGALLAEATTESGLARTIAANVGFSPELPAAVPAGFMSPLIAAATIDAEVRTTARSMAVPRTTPAVGAELGAGPARVAAPGAETPEAAGTGTAVARNAVTPEVLRLPSGGSPVIAPVQPGFGRTATELPAVSVSVAVSAPRALTAARPPAPDTGAAAEVPRTMVSGGAKTTTRSAPVDVGLSAKRGDVPRRAVSSRGAETSGVATGVPAGAFVSYAGVQPVSAEPGGIRRAQVESSAPRAGERAIPAVPHSATSAATKGAAAIGNQLADTAAAETAISKSPDEAAGLSGVVEGLVTVARMRQSVYNEAIAPPVRAVERPRRAGGIASAEPAAVEAVRSAAAEAHGGKSSVAAPAPFPLEPVPVAAGRVEAAAVAPGIAAPDAASDGARMAAAAEELQAVGVPGAARSAHSLLEAGAPAQAGWAERRPDLPRLDERHVASTDASPLFADASTAAPARCIEERMDSGELLLAAAPGAQRLELSSLWPGKPTLVVSVSEPRREVLPPSRDTGAPVREVDTPRPERPAGDAPATRLERVRVEVERTAASRADAERGRIGHDVTMPPARQEVDRVPAANLLGPRTTGSVSFALVRYSGDWDCDRTAMPNLAYQLERRVGILLSTEAREIAVTDPKLLQQPFIFISGHKDFRFTDAEISALRKYIAAGGSIWINDSTEELDQTFDIAVRRELGRLLPAQPIVRLPANHAVFSSCYDLTRGFKGYRVPPGDKYRCDYLEGIDVGGRTAVIYTRNDYGDGLEIDPNTAPLMPSLTDLSPRDMQEGSVRMGINIVLHFLDGRAGGPNAEQIAEQIRANTARTEREQQAEAETAETTMFESFDGEFSWSLHAGWGDAADVAAVPAPGAPAGAKDKRMKLRFAVGDKKKVVVGRELSEEADFSKYDALLINFTSELPAGCRVAVGLVTMPGWQYFESPPAYVRPGANLGVAYRLDRPDFKCEASGWQYNSAVAYRSAVHQIVLLVYPICGGTIYVDNIRLARFRGPVAGPAR